MLQGYARSAALFVLLRGRPRLDIPLLTSYPEFPPIPPPGGADMVGDPRAAGKTGPWLVLVQNTLHHRDAHVLKAVRALYYVVQRYGGTVPGARSARAAQTGRIRTWRRGRWTGRCSCARQG